MNFQNAANACITATCPPGDLAAAKLLQKLECGTRKLIFLFITLTSSDQLLLSCSCCQARRWTLPLNVVATLFAVTSPLYATRALDCMKRCTMVYEYGLHAVSCALRATVACLRPSDHGWLGRTVIVLSFDRQQGNFSDISSTK